MTNDTSQAPVASTINSYIDAVSNWFIWTGDARDILKNIPDESVQCCVTSPPYYQLRSYNGGDAEIGQESTPQEYISRLVAVFEEVRRVLADDGTCWVNIGDSYANSSPGGTQGKTGERASRTFTAAGAGGSNGTVSNLANFVHAQLKGGVLFYGSTDPRGRAAKRIHVLIQDKTAPDSILQPLLTAKRVVIENGQYDLCEVGGGLDAPVVCWASSSLFPAHPTDADSKRLMNVSKDVRIIITTSELDADAPFRVAPTFSVEDGETPFAVKVPGEPIAEGIASGVPALDTLMLYTGPERIPNVDPVNQSVAFLDGANLRARPLGNVSVRKATEKQVTLGLHDGTEVCVQRVGHLFLLTDGILPYRSILVEATAQQNETRPKQELGIPEMLKRALMRAGWICRQSIIWHKPNPMPESVTDRCTKSHEYLFLLTKKATYYYDAAAIAEDAIKPAGSRAGYAGYSGVSNRAHAMGRAASGNEKPEVVAFNKETRNRRSVWTVAPQQVTLRHDLTDEQRSYVVAELLRRGLL